MNEHWLLGLFRRFFGRTQTPIKEPVGPSLFDIPRDVASVAPVRQPATPPPFLLPRADRPVAISSDPVVTGTVIPTPISTEGPNPSVTPVVPKKRMYVNSHIGLRVRSEPHVGNNILEILLYGDMVRIDRQEDSWAHVEYGDGHIGWASIYYLSEDMPPDALQSPLPGKLPHFVVAQPNRADDRNTLEVRLVIRDEFGGGANKWDLQCTEYVQYKLSVRGIAPVWPADRPRNGGKWAEIFERNRLYSVSAEPSVGAAVCFTSGFVSREANEIGHVAYVEGVFADGSIKVSEANWPPPGKYNERIIPKREWQDRYKARFVKFA